MGQGKDRNITIYARPLAGNPGQYQFAMNKGFGADEVLEFDKSDDGMWKWENYRITFHLKNEDGANLKFSRRLDKVLWAKPTNETNPPCPAAQEMDGIFWVKQASDVSDGKVVVTNRDPDRQRFIFAFNFLPATVNESSSTPASDYILYDPIGNNQNGGWPRSFAMIAPTTIGGTAIGAVVGALAAPMFNPEPVMATYVWGALIGGLAGYAIGLILGKPARPAVGGA